MWKKIDSPAVAESLNIGDIISEKPDDPYERYVIKLIQDGFILAVHAYGKVSLKGLPARALISGNWWVEEDSSK